MAQVVTSKLYPRVAKVKIGFYSKASKEKDEQELKRRVEQLYFGNCSGIKVLEIKVRGKKWDVGT